MNYRYITAACLGIAAAAAGEAPARADIEVGVFAGAHFFSQSGALGRGNFLANTASPDYANSAFQDSGIFGLRLAWLIIPRLALEGEVGLSPTGSIGSLYGQPNKQVEVGVIPLRAHLLVNLLKGRLRPFLLAGGGVELSSPYTPGGLNTGAVGEVHAGGGLSFDVRPWWGLRLEGRAVFPQGRDSSGGPGTLTTEGEVLLGIYGRFGPPPGPRPTAQDRDGDGVPNSADRCPDVAGPAANAGCPDKDTDGDGIVDRLDRCPRDKGPAENGGCPDTDADRDGVVDRLDRCAAVPGKKDYGGCPDLDGPVPPPPPPQAAPPPPPPAPPPPAPPPQAAPPAEPPPAAPPAESPPT